MRPLPAITLRPAVPDDIGFMMATERLPGYEWLLGQWSAGRHAEVLADPANGVLMGLDAQGLPQGFAILRDLDNVDGNIYLQRIAMVRPGGGFGRALLHAVTGWVFDLPAAHRFWLLVKDGNERALHVYRSSGFIDEGRLRETLRTPHGDRCDAFQLSILRSEWPSTAASATT